MSESRAEESKGGSGPHTHTSFIISEEIIDRLPASGMDASHPESHMDADSVSLDLYSQLERIFQLILILPPWLSGTTDFALALRTSTKV
jgi:hypothetical protein